MGCYDSVRFRCPSCSQRFVQQSKAGDCRLADYDSQQVPLTIAADLDGDEVFCPHCNAGFRAVADSPTTVSVYLMPLRGA